MITQENALYLFMILALCLLVLPFVIFAINEIKKERSAREMAAYEKRMFNKLVSNPKKFFEEEVNQ